MWVGRAADGWPAAVKAAPLLRLLLPLVMWLWPPALRCRLLLGVARLLQPRTPLLLLLLLLLALVGRKVRARLHLLLVGLVRVAVLILVPGKRVLMRVMLLVLLRWAVRCRHCRMPLQRWRLRRLMRNLGRWQLGMRLQLPGLVRHVPRVAGCAGHSQPLRCALLLATCPPTARATCSRHADCGPVACSRANNVPEPLGQQHCLLLLLAAAKGREHRKPTTRAGWRLPCCCCRRAYRLCGRLPVHLLPHAVHC